MNQNQEDLAVLNELEAGLRRLGVRELEERLEVSPLLAPADVSTTDRCTCEISCSGDEDIPEMQDGFLPWGTDIP